MRTDQEIKDNITRDQAELIERELNKTENANTLKALASEPISAYSETGHARKEKYHRIARKQLHKLADQLDLDPDDYDIRSNKGGIAVCGEITLHTDSLYIQVSQSCLGGGHEIMYRGCDGRKDYGGKMNGRYANRWAPASALDDPRAFVDLLDCIMLT